MELIHSDTVFISRDEPDYSRENPLEKLKQRLDTVSFAAGPDMYRLDDRQFLIPIDHLELFGPKGEQWRQADPARQTVKTDSQKQNLRDFKPGSATLVRGLALVDGTPVPFLQIGYCGGPETILAREAADADLTLGDSLKAWVEVGREDSGLFGAVLEVPFDAETNTYKVELWGYRGDNLAEHLDERGRESLERGFLLNRPDLILGDGAFSYRPDTDMRDVNPEHTLHAVLPLTVLVAWSDGSRRVWDSRGGLNYRYQFDMKLRGASSYLKCGTAQNPNGGMGSLSYKTLFSNYALFEDSGELGRDLEAWNTDAFGDTGHGAEPFMAVDYMDLQTLSAGAAIGLHRHRDNQEVFLMMRGSGLMVVGDWAKFPQRERCFEVRTLRAGHLVLIKGGNIHGLLNHTDQDSDLFVFGGYD